MYKGTIPDGILDAGFRYSCSVCKSLYFWATPPTSLQFKYSYLLPSHIKQTIYKGRQKGLHLTQSWEEINCSKLSDNA